MSDINESDLNEETPFVDFSDLDDQVKNENKEKKDQIKEEVMKSENNISENNTSTNNEINDKLKDVLNDGSDSIETPKKTSKKKKEDVNEENVSNETEQTTLLPPKTKDKDNKIVLEGEEEKNEEVFIADENAELPSELEEELLNSVDPKSRLHRVITDETEVKKEEYIVDSDNKETIVDEETLSEKDLQEKAKKRKQLEEYYEKQTGLKVYGGEGGIPCIYASDNPNLKALKEVDIPSDKIKPIANDDEVLKKNFMEQYITLTNAKDSTVVDHRISRFPCLLSGYYAEMTDFSIGELTSMIRIIRNPEFKFAYKFQQELIMIYNHISWTSLKPNGEKLSFEEWLKSTKFKDLDMFYYGAYDATYPGLSKYDITCGNCHNIFTIEKQNRALAYLLQNGNDPILKDTFVKDVMMERIPVDEMKKTLVYKKANKNYDEKVIKPHNIKISYGCPTLMDILEYLSVFESHLSEIEDLEALIDDSMDGHNLLTMYTMIKSITVPVNRGKNSDGKIVISFYKVDTEIDDDEKRMENRKYIISILKNLPELEFSELFTGKELAEMKRLIGITPILHNITCPHCNANIARIPVEMRGNFFMKTANVVDQIEQF